MYVPNRNFHNQIIDNRPMDEFKDRRLNTEHSDFRFNIRDRENIRANNLDNFQDVRYLPDLICSTCNEELPKFYFENYSINIDVRQDTGYNINCRYCIDNQKTCGYNVDHIFVSSKDDHLYDEIDKDYQNNSDIENDDESDDELEDELEDEMEDEIDQTVDDSLKWTTEHPSIGYDVAQYFHIDGNTKNPQKLFRGKVVKYLPKTRQCKNDQLYQILWEDGDECQYDYPELCRGGQLYLDNINS
jgi:hypothetical protein